MESRDDQRRGGGNPAPATTYIILSRSGAGYLGSYDFVTLGGPANCCGIVHHLGEDYDVSEKLSDSSTAKIARFRPHNVVTICPNCNYQYENVVSKTTEVPFEMVQFYEFLHARLADLPIRGNFAKRIGPAPPRRLVAPPGSPRRGLHRHPARDTGG